MRRTALGVSLVGLMVLAMTAIAADGGERFRGRIANLGGPAAGQTWWMTLQADTYTSDEDVVRLATILAEQGQEAMMKEMATIEPVGWIRVGEGTSYHLRVIRTFTKPDGSRVVRAYTDRPIQIPEIFEPSRTRKYTLGMVEIQLDPEGGGGGTLMPLCQIRFTEANTIEVETFGTQPFRVMNVKAEATKAKK